MFHFVKCNNWDKARNQRHENFAHLFTLDWDSKAGSSEIYARHIVLLTVFVLQKLRHFSFLLLSQLAVDFFNIQIYSQTHFFFIYSLRGMFTFVWYNLNEIFKYDYHLVQFFSFYLRCLFTLTHVRNIEIDRFIYASKHPIIIKWH